MSQLLDIFRIELMFLIQLLHLIFVELQSPIETGFTEFPTGGWPEIEVVICKIHSENVPVELIEIIDCERCYERIDLALVP